MKKVYIIGHILHQSVVDQVKKDYPDHEVVCVKDENEIRKIEFQTPEPIPYVMHHDLPVMPSLRACDMTQNSPWKEPHHSSKRSRKY